jgi:hypothetical protein
MVKGWADHCSTDSESDWADRTNALGEEDNKEAPAETQDAQKDEVELPKEVHEDDLMEPPAATQRYNFSTEAPYTAFVGNLAYKILEPQDMADGIAQLAQEHLNLEIHVVDCKIVMDRNHATPRHRGYGYMTVESLDELKALMQLNDMGVELEGRAVQLDTANGKRSGDRQASSGDRHHGNRHNDRRHRSGDRPFDRPHHDRQLFDRPHHDRPHHDNKFFERPSDQQNERQTSVSSEGRQPLKLQPRTRPVDKQEETRPSEIFGGAKARDENTWNERRKSETQQQPDGARRAVSGGRGRGREGDRKHSGREGVREGGRDGGHGGREGGRGHREVDHVPREGSHGQRDASHGNRDGGHGGRDGGHGGRDGGHGGRDGGHGGRDASHGNRDGGHGNQEGGSHHGGRGRGRGRGENMRTTSRWNTKPEQKHEEKKAPPAPVESADKPVEKKVVNKFAPLGFDSDSD